MKKELLKGFTMLVLIVMLALASAVASNAQPLHKLVADIPFDFSVGYKILPAGQYTVKALAADNTGLLIQSADESTSVLRLSEATGPAKDKAYARLVFHRYGERYFLAEVWDGADRTGTGRQLVKSQEERTIESEVASLSLQSADGNSIYETIEVIARVALQSAKAR